MQIMQTSHQVNLAASRNSMWQWVSKVSSFWMRKPCDTHQTSGGEGELWGDLDNDHPFPTPNRGDVHIRQQGHSSSHNDHNMHQQSQSESHRISLYESPWLHGAPHVGDTLSVCDLQRLT
jgi:hypothetical protein